MRNKTPTNPVIEAANDDDDESHGNVEIPTMKN